MELRGSLGALSWHTGLSGLSFLCLCKSASLGSEPSNSAEPDRGQPAIRQDQNRSEKPNENFPVQGERKTTSLLLD